VPGTLDPDATLADLSEDALLALMVPLLGAGPPGGLGPGDDAALVSAPDGAVVATTDAMVRGRDWRDAWSSGSDVGAKAVAQNLADIAAMGARPTGLLVTLVADPATSVAWVLQFARGLGEAAQAAHTPVVGGDLSSAPAGTLLACVTALGCLDGHAPVLRSGARPGHVVAVAGTLGLAAAGWQLLESGQAHTHPQAVACQLRPNPPIRLGPVAAQAGASAMLDISDGLLRDAARLADASNVRLDLDPAALQEDVDRIVPALPAEQALECVLAGGEEHSLLATFPDALPVGWRAVGRVSDGAGVTLGGRQQRPRGWDHFAG
jgi:thiamine-monophosphate kinase